MSRYIDLDQIEFLKVDGNKEFNHGVDCCINRLLEAEPIEVVSLDKVKHAREEIEKQSYPESSYGFGCGKDKVVSMDLVWEILDKLIIESEEKE